MLVGVGFDSVELDEIEIIDLQSKDTKCDNMAKFPVRTLGAIGGLDYNDNPLICGGWMSQVSSKLILSQLLKGVNTTIKV